MTVITWEGIKTLCKCLKQLPKSANLHHTNTEAVFNGLCKTYVPPSPQTHTPHTNTHNTHKYSHTKRTQHTQSAHNTHKAHTTHTKHTQHTQSTPPLPHTLTHTHTLHYPKHLILVLKITLVVELWLLWSSCQPSAHFDFRWQLSGQVHEDSAMNAIVHRPLDAKTHPGGKVVSTVLMCSFWPPLLARFDRRAGSSCVMCINLNKPPTRSVVATRKKTQLYKLGVEPWGY